MTPSDLRSIRREAGLSMNGLARLLGVTSHAVYMWESGRRGISKVTEIAVRAVISKKEEER